jgi:copper chaperone CopZ
MFFCEEAVSQLLPRLKSGSSKQHEQKRMIAIMDPKCHVEPVTKVATPEELVEVQRLRLNILGMGCENCALRVKNSLLSLLGVVTAEVDHLNASATVSYNPGMVDLMDLAEAVTNADASGRHDYRIVSALRF